MRTVLTVLTILLMEVCKYDSSTCYNLISSLFKMSQKLIERVENLEYKVRQLAEDISLSSRIFMDRTDALNEIVLKKDKFGRKITIDAVQRRRKTKQKETTSKRRRKTRQRR